MQRWTQARFESEIAAWQTKLKENTNAPALVSIEFSYWTFRDRYIARRFEDFEVHIVYSVPHGCPSACLSKVKETPQLGEGFVGSFDFHPITDEVAFLIHACETKAIMGLLDIDDKAPGIALLSWWSIIANSALRLRFEAETFILAKQCLEDVQ